jgi:hypothetical protein
MTFLYQCALRFEELPGTSDRHRRCDVCAKLVTNLDALTGEDRRTFLQRAAEEEKTVCLSMVEDAQTKACGGRERLDAIAADKLKPLDAPPKMGTVLPQHMPKR